VLETIKSAREIDTLFERGTRASNAYVSVLVIPTPERRGRNGRVVVIAGKKIGNAVLRNRAKRVLRESVRRVDGPWAGFDVALIARTRASSADPVTIDAAIRAALQRVGVDMK